jgi:uncharacterized Zn finger protein
MTEGSVIYLFCEGCGEETPHRILKGKLGPTMESGFDGTVQCIPCGVIHPAHIEMEKPINVRSIISEKGRSTRTDIEFFPKEIIRIGDELMWEDHNFLVTSIEKGTRRVDKAEASEVDSIWLKLFDTVDIKVSIVEGANTKSERIEAAPEEEFAVGDLLEFGRMKVVITKIKKEKRMVYREGSPVQAREIKRVYTKRVRERHY